MYLGQSINERDNTSVISLTCVSIYGVKYCLTLTPIEQKNISVKILGRIGERIAIELIWCDKNNGKLSCIKAVIPSNCKYFIVLCDID